MRLAPTSSRSAGFSLPWLTIALAGIALFAWRLPGPAPAIAFTLAAIGLAFAAWRTTVGATAVVPALGTGAVQWEAEDVPPSPAPGAAVWSTVRDALRFVAERLERDDPADLASACDAVDADPVSPSAFRRLRELHLERDVLARLGRIRFPGRPGRFTVGGHAGPLDHVHLEFVSADGARWRLRRLWACR